MWIFSGRPKTQNWLFCGEAFSDKEPCHSSAVSPRNFPKDFNFTSYFKWKSLETYKDFLSQIRNLRQQQLQMFVVGETNI